MATMARDFSLNGQVKYCPFHSQYVICSFPYDRSVIRFKNVRRYSPVPFFSRLFRARANSSAGVAGRKSNFIEADDLEKHYQGVLGWNKAACVASYGILIVIYAISVLTDSLV